VLITPTGEVQSGFRQTGTTNLILAKAQSERKVFAMANVLATDKQRTALQMLVEGNSLRSVTRLTGSSWTKKCGASN
jgi:hypothetical protein